MVIPTKCLHISLAVSMGNPINDDFWYALRFNIFFSKKMDYTFFKSVKNKNILLCLDLFVQTLILYGT